MARNTKAKIKRTAKNYGVDLSNEISLPSLDQFTTREDFNKWKSSVKSFTNPHNLQYQYKKNEHGYVKDKKSINEAERAIKRSQRIADKKIKAAEKKPFVSGGKTQITQKQQALQLGKGANAGGIYRPADFDFNKIQNEKAFQAKKEAAEKRGSTRYYDERMETMKENFIDQLTVSFNNIADELIEKIKEIPANDFYEMYMMFDEFDFDLYDSDGQFIGDYLEAKGNVGQMMVYVEMYERGEINFNLGHKNFSRNVKQWQKEEKERFDKKNGK